MTGHFRHTLDSWDELQHKRQVQQSRRLLKHSLLIDGLRREALVYVPRHKLDRGPLPLVLVLHGGSSTPETIAKASGLHKIAEREGFIVVYPAGTKSGSTLTWTPSEGMGPRKSEDVRFLRKLINELLRNHPVDPDRIFAAGFSIGGSLVYELAEALSDRMAAMAIVGGTMTATECRPEQPVALIHIHGTDDRRVPFDGGKGPATAAKHHWLPVRNGIDLWRAANGCDPTPTTMRHGLEGVTSHRYSGRADVELWIVEGGRHIWPGGSGRAGPKEDGDAEPTGTFSASETIWRFFAAHQKAAPSLPPRTGPRLPPREKAAW